MPRAPRIPRAMSRTPARSRPRSLTARPTLLGAGVRRAAGLRLDVFRVGVERLAEVFDREALDGRVRDEEATVATTLTPAPRATRGRHPGRAGPSSTLPSRATGGSRGPSGPALFPPDPRALRGP